jgi:Ku protein
MAARPYWKGVLKLSLVVCPVALYSAITDAERTRFHKINRKTGNRLRQQMVDERTGQVVPRDRIGRGYEVDKGRYVEIAADELEAVEIESTHTIEIDSFVPRTDVDRRYLERPYYIVPDGKIAVEAYAVIRDAMKDKDRVALGRIVVANREQVMAIEPLGSGLLGTSLRYDYEMRDETELFEAIPDPKIPKDMIKLAEHILATKEARFDPATFKDRYETALKALVRRKASGKVIRAPEARPERGNVVDLMDALRRSVAGSAGNVARKTARTSSEARRRSA